MGDFRARDYIPYAAHIVRARARLRAAERWPLDRRRAATQDHLARVLHHAVTAVPYYRETLAPFRHRFDAMVADLDLSPLPLLTKDDIRRAGSALHAADAARRRTSIARTSGTTGTPMAVMLDSDSHVAQFAGIWNMLGWTGYRFGQRYADLHGVPLANDAWFRHDRRLNCLRTCSAHLSRDTVAAFNDRLAAFRPAILKGTPSNLYVYARLLEEAGIEPWQPPVILTCAETVHPHYRDALRRVFAASRVFDFYNQNERACLISTCEHGTYHIHEDYSFVELNGDGPEREIVATSLHNTVMPLIRYQTGDVAAVGNGQPCACGRGHRTVARIVGRSHDVVATPDGRFCNSFGYAFQGLPGVRFAQIYQADPSRVEVRLVVADSFDRIATTRRLAADMRGELGDEIAIDFTFPKTIAPGANGKIQFIVSKPGRDLIAAVPSPVMQAAE